MLNNVGSKTLFDSVFKSLIRFAFCCVEKVVREERSVFSRARKRRVSCCRGGHIFVLSSLCFIIASHCGSIMEYFGRVVNIPFVDV